MNTPVREQLTIHLDLSSLDGFLCLEPTLRLIDELEIPVMWLPISSGLDRVSSKQPENSLERLLIMDDPLAQYKARRAKARRGFEQREHARNCHRLGITLAQGYRDFDATFAHIGLLYMNQLNIDPRDYISGAYRAGFAQGKNLETVEALNELLQVLGITTTGLDHYLDTGKTQFKVLTEALLEQGVFSSPAYLYQGQTYQGRQHLPLLRWHFGGSRGTPPV